MVYDCVDLWKQVLGHINYGNSEQIHEDKAAKVKFILIVVFAKTVRNQETGSNVHNYLLSKLAKILFVQSKVCKVSIINYRGLEKRSPFGHWARKEQLFDVLCLYK